MKPIFKVWARKSIEEFKAHIDDILGVNMSLDDAEKVKNIFLKYVS